MKTSSSFGHSAKASSVGHIMSDTCGTAATAGAAGAAPEIKKRVRWTKLFLDKR